MLFNSFVFVAFLAVVLLVYWTLPHRRPQNVFLLAASLFFYGFGGWQFIGLILTCALAAYLAGLMIELHPHRTRWALTIGALIPLGILFFFKYFDFFVESVLANLAVLDLDVSDLTLRLALPIGISFFTFQSVGYVADVSRGKVPAERNLVDFLLFVTFFPQLVAGPIERADHLLPQLKRERTLDDADIGTGTFLILQGYVKKVVIADNIKPVVDSLFEFDSLSAPLIVAALIGFTFQIYGDFSGYTDIARGVARLMGFDLLLNFRRPYWAANPSEFWRRWHITLSNWFRDYVYIALGGNRRGRLRVYLNLFLTMVLSGLWHGASANFIVWGAYHGVLLIGHRLFRTVKGPASSNRLLLLASRAAMFTFTVYGWMLFRVTEWSTIVEYTRALFGDWSAASLGIATLFTLLPYVGTSVIIDVVEAAALRADRREPAGSWIHAPYFAALGILILVFGAETGGEFIYFKF